MNRRSFLNFGRSGVLPQTPWDEFCHGIQRTVRGKFKDISVPNAPFGAAEIWIERLGDIQHLFAYAQAHHVVLALAGCTIPTAVTTRHLLIVHFSDKLNQIEKVGEQASLVQPSVKVSDLFAQGYQQFARVPGDLTIAQWFASPQYHDCRPYHSFLSGVERISVMFADGSQAILGGFGVNDRSALSVPILNRCIPNLFELLRDEEVEQSLQQDVWPYPYRLDSLSKQFVDINLARIFQGHQGRLLWVQQWVIRKIPEDVLLLPEFSVSEDKDNCTHSAIEARIKGLFDAEGVFLYDDEVKTS